MLRNVAQLFAKGKVSQVGGLVPRVAASPQVCWRDGPVACWMGRIVRQVDSAVLGCL